MLGLLTVLRVASLTVFALGFGLVLPITTPLPRSEQRLRHLLTAAVIAMLVVGRLTHR